MINKSTVLLAALGMAGAARTDQERRPNLLVLLTDDQRLNTLGVYDANCPIQTPNIDRLANEGIRFDNGFVTTPICVASRASILTGRYANNAGVHEFLVPMPQESFMQSYPVLLRKAGYFTGMLGKYGVGITKDQEKEFDLYDGQASQGPTFRDYKGRKVHDSEWLTLRTEEFLDLVPRGKPFVLQLNYKAPHGSSAVAPEDEGLLAGHVFGRHPMDTPEENRKLPEFVRNSYLEHCYRREFNPGGDHNPFLRGYFEKIVSVERSVGKILELLEQRGLADNTVIIFLSDHGVHFGEKQLYGKWTPYEASLRIPFIVYDPRPGAKKGAVLDQMVLNIDVAPTLMELAGLPVPKVMDGRSLVPLLTPDSGPLSPDPRPLTPDSRPLTPEKWRSHFFFEHFTSPSPAARYIARNEGVRLTDRKFIRWIDPQAGGAEEFYDLSRDPEEGFNLIANPEFMNDAAKARSLFESWRKDNPSTFTYDSYQRRAQALAPEIDWDKFRQVRPKEYQKIAAEVARLGVTWEQAMNDWKIRFEISSKAGYWY
jgi:arylsulfatase A-like enzyme